MTMPGFWFSLSIMAAMYSPSLLPTALLRGLLISSLALVVGGLAFTPLVLMHSGLTEFRVVLRSRGRALLLSAIVFAAITSLLEYVYSSSEHTTPGTESLWVRIILLLFVWILVYLKRDDTRWVLIPAALLSLTRSLQSHAAGTTDWMAPVLADWIHLTFASIWLGGVAMLALVVVPLVMRPSQRYKELGIVLARFSPLALFCVFGVALTGLAQSAAMVGSLQALTDTDYGQTVLVKIAIFIILIGFGAFHQQIISPHLQAWRLRDVENAQTATLRFRWSIIAELLVSAILLAVVGLLVSLPLPGQTL